MEKEEKNKIRKKNSGDRTSGDMNSGNRNSGNCNSGDRNSGYCNSGYCNSGYCNSGDWNSGDWNSGYCNSGYWNSGDRNSGFLNTNKPKVRIFNKETNLRRDDINFPDYFYFNLTKWIDSDDMSEGEKEENPEHETTNGYLKSLDYKEAWKKSFEKYCNEKQAEQTINLPNFDYDIFEEISGITKAMLDEKRGIKSKEIDIELKDLSKESLLNIIRKLKKYARNK